MSPHDTVGRRRAVECPAMRRRLFTLAAAVSGVLCVSLCVLWLRSYWVEDRLGISHRWSYAWFASFRGEIGCEFGRLYDGGPRDMQDMYASRPRVR